MKALTIKQPWADAIVYGSKRVENRTWGTRYRGALAIHAGKSVDLDGRSVVRDVEGRWDDSIEPLGRLGAFIGLGTLRDVHERRPGCCPGDPYAERGDGVHHWVIRAPIALVEPIDHKGQLGLWQVRDDVAEAIVEASRGRRCGKQFQ